jgi:hypothetical protein
VDVHLRKQSATEEEKKTSKLLKANEKVMQKEQKVPLVEPPT